MLATSKYADVYAYVDDDQIAMYEHKENPRIVGASVVYGPRIGPIAAVNSLYRQNPDYDCYLVMTDDCTLTVDGWDSWLLDVVGMGGVVAASPTHSLGQNVDFAAVSGEFARRLGWVCYPGCYHWCWPSVIEALGEATRMVHAPPDTFHIDHVHLESMNQELSHTDTKQLYAFFAYGRYQTALKELRA